MLNDSPNPQKFNSQNIHVIHEIAKRRQFPGLHRDFSTTKPRCCYLSYIALTHILPLCEVSLGHITNPPKPTLRSLTPVRAHYSGRNITVHDEADTLSRTDDVVSPMQTLLAWTSAASIYSVLSSRLDVCRR